MKNVLAIVLGGGAGTRLYPLTKLRAKPAVPLAGMYRLIDIPISNCINSDLYRIYVLTQFNSASLNRHVARAYNLRGPGDNFVEVLAAQQTPNNPHWFQGTADAVRQYMGLFQEWDVDEYLILSGDHLYRMDYRRFIQRHRETNADITLSVVPIDEARASAFGLMKLDDRDQVVEFSEKPEGDALRRMQVDTSSLGLSPEDAQHKPYIASMGIYVFKREVLATLLDRYSEHTDFGKEIIPAAAADHNLQVHLFDGYWEDIGTIKSFYDANLALTQDEPPFNFYDEGSPIYTRARHLPPSKLHHCEVEDAIISDGCVLKNCQINHSILGIRSRVKEGSVIQDSLIMGADYYKPKSRSSLRSPKIPIGIGANSTIRGAIVDKNACIGAGVQIVNKDRIQEANQEDLGFYIRNGIVVVLKSAVIPDGMVI